MRPGAITMTIVMVAVALLASLDGRSSFGQQERIPPNRKPACTIFCSDATMDYVVLGEHPKCFGGPLPARTAGDQFKDVSEEDRKAACEKLKTSDKTAESCPALKILLAACKEKEAPPPEKEPLKCKERSSDVPWFDPSAEGCQQLQDTRMNANWTAMNGGTCTLTLTACNYTALTYAVNLVSEKNGKLETVIFADRPTPANLASMGVRPIRRAECTPQLYDALVGDHPNTVCCDVWREGVNAGSGCNPERDADCDGLPNDRDHYLNSAPYDAPPRPGSYQETFFGGAGDFNQDNFDPRPPGLSWDELMPNEPCKKCKWTAVSGKLTCSPDGRSEHEYKATWVCPTTGVQRTLTKRAPASAPCTSPNRRG